MKALLLCAGEGARLRPHTLVKPKPAIPFLNVPLAYYSVHFLKDLSIDTWIANTFYLPNQIVLLLGELSLPLHFSHESPHILGSGGAIKQAEKWLNGPDSFIVTNADEVILPLKKDYLKNALDFHNSKDAIATLLTTTHPDVGNKFGGVWVTESNQICGFGKTPSPGSKQGLHYIGVLILSPRIFPYILKGPSNILYDALANAIRKGEKAFAYPLACQWFETGNEADFLLASEQCLKYLSKEGAEKDYLKSVLDDYSPSSHFEIQNHNFILRDKSTQIPTNVQIKDFVILGKNIRFQGSALLQSAVIGDGLTLPSACRVINELKLSLEDPLA